MKEFKSSELEDQEFNDSITIVEKSDLVNADNNNAAPKQVFQNTVALRNQLNGFRYFVNGRRRLCITQNIDPQE